MQSGIDILIDTNILIKLTEPIKELAIEYKIQYKLKTPDAIIAATARYLKMPLVTADKKVSGIENIVVVLFTSSI